MKTGLLGVVLVLGACGGGTPPRVVVAAPASAVAAGAAVPVVDPGATPMRLVSAATFEPLFPGRDGKKQIPVAPFRLETHPVTNAQFAAFVAAEPRWRRSVVVRLFADTGYLAHWRADLEPGPDLADRPVTAVSWFAARAYARWRGRRLPTLAEWESAAAMPLANGADAVRAVLEWYARPGSGGTGPVGSGVVTELGIADLHGLVWELVDDFGTAMVTGDARGDTDLQRSLFCGAGAVGASRPEDYAAFMRYALRSSLRGESTTRNLGFRCAADPAEKD
jgi:formylglycine-generating enzyme required for sulfatase activity